MSFHSRRDLRRDRVVISGFGCLTPVGNDRHTLWQAYREGRSGIGTIDAFDPGALRVRIAGEVRDIDPFEHVPPKDRRHVSRTAALALGAARQALEDAKLCLPDLDSTQRQRIGVVLGSGGGGLEFTERQYAHYYGGNLWKASIYSIPTSTIGTLSSELSMAFDFHGPSHVVSTGCTSSTDAIFYACQSILTRQTDIVLTGGADAPIAPGILSGFCMMRILTESWNDEPTRGSRPFSEDRDGFVLGEGAWIYVVESEESARARGAPVYAEIAGYGSTCDAYHRVRLDESGVEPARAMTLAMKDAGVAPSDVDYVNLHGTSTVLNDRVETRAIKIGFGAAAGRIAMSASKSMFGHPQGASGAAGLSAALFAIGEGTIPPTLNLEEPDEECDLDYTALMGRTQHVSCALANCIGFGSKNSALVLKKV